MIKQTREEIANTLTHFSGVVLALIIGTMLVIKSSHGDGWQSMFACIIFGLAVLLMYSASTIYHWALPGKGKKILRYLDHINIYVLIAASYTPILICSVGGVLGWVMFGIMWGIALGGAFYKIFLLGKYPKLSLSIYLIMGWSGIIIAKSVWTNTPNEALLLILLEGIAYTSGTYFYARDSKHPYYHAIWHIFVLIGTLSHFGAVWMIL